MSKRIETEKKYYCLKEQELISKIDVLKFKLVKEGIEIDEYFTDINSIYIKNRTCLRIRKANDSMEITFKGKSNDFSSSFTKLESNFDMDLNNYENFVELFSMIGYYSYTIVNKKRLTYELKDEKYTYSIMVDNIEGLGGFVEFELLCNSDDYDLDELKIKLNQFVSMFNSLNLTEAKLPYRDFVALKQYNDLKPKKEIKGVHLNIDTFLKKYEKDFYNYYKSLLKDDLNTSLKKKEFKENIYDSLINSDISRKIDNYFDSLRIQDSNFIALFELLHQMKSKGLDIVLTTNCNETFISNVIAKITNGYIFDNIVYLKDSKSIYTVAKKNGVDLNNYFNVLTKNIRDTNSLLLVIINNYGITK